MKRFEDYFDQIILERFLATTIKREHNIIDFLDKNIIKYLKRDFEIKEYNEHGFHKYKKEKIDIKNETYKKLTKYSQMQNVKIRDIIQSIMEEVIWEYYFDDIEIPEFSFSFEEEIEKQNKKTDLKLEVGKQYDFVEYNEIGKGLADVGDYEVVEIAMISKKFPKKYIDKDKNIKMIEKNFLKNLSIEETERIKNNIWVLLEIVKTNEENILLWVQKENLNLYIKEKKET